jgi:dienelactone hydrolase
MHTETMTYTHGNTKLKGFIAYSQDTKTNRPAVIIAHAWKGQDEFARNKAKELAEQGYVGFAIDIYGDGKEAKSNEEAVALMMPFFIDRKLLQERMKAAYEAISKHPMVNSQNIGGIGFCFGGLAIIELFRSGVDIKGVCSFHAVVSNEMHGATAKIVPIAKKIKGSILILHGYDDPLASNEDIEAIQAELTEAKVDWQMNIYGQTSHAFTNPEANDKSLGLIYNPKSNERSWVAMCNFFDEVFS